jgi:hypothetical protein
VALLGDRRHRPPPGCPNTNYGFDADGPFKGAQERGAFDVAGVDPNDQRSTRKAAERLPLVAMSAGTPPSCTCPGFPGAGVFRAQETGSRPWGDYPAFHGEGTRQPFPLPLPSAKEPTVTATPITSRTAEVIDTYRTTELTTLGGDGTPLTWPTAVSRRPDGSLLVTTSLAYAQKALNVRLDGRVSLLFSDPTGSGRTDLPQVFVQGTATCPEQIRTGPDEAAEYWRRLFERQPLSASFVRPSGRWLMDWYYMRLFITITPERVETRTPLAESLTAEPGPELVPPPGGTGGSGPLGAELVARFASGVLGVRDASGAPLLARVRPRPGGLGFVIDAGVPEEAVPGAASLLVHQHDEHLGAMRNALVRGDLRREADRWVLVPGKVVEPMGNGRRGSTIRVLREARRSTKRYLERRGLDRPRIEWDRFQELLPKEPRA